MLQLKCQPGRQTRIIVAFVALLSFCSVAIADEANSKDATSAPLPQYVIDIFGNPPQTPTGPLSDKIVNALDTAFGKNLETLTWGEEQTNAVQTIADSGDPRLAWLLSDMMRISSSYPLTQLLAISSGKLLDLEFENEDYWRELTDSLMAWNIPAPPNYLQYKRNIYTIIEPVWDRLFVEGDIDWRYVSWGGVLIDNRPFDKTDELCNCIPAADNPEVTAAEDATWLKDDDVVFGIEVNGEYRAYPRRIMEVREMVNDTLGGRELGIPYCTLCGAAQAYFTDQQPEGVDRPVLRTSGLLIRSNKVMYDVNTYSVFDTFKGNAVTGPLASEKIALAQAGVVTAEWKDWKTAHPETTVLAESLALGRDFDFRNNRDANGPIFPIGNVDPRLPVQEDIVGLIAQSGKPIAFQLSKAIDALNDGKAIAFENIRLELNGGGVRAVDANGDDLGGHQAFWFAWSQFYPETQLWPM